MENENQKLSPQPGQTVNPVQRSSVPTQSSVSQVTQRVFANQARGDIAPIDQIDIPKKFGKYKQIRGIIIGILFIPFGIIVGLAIRHSNHQAGNIMLVILPAFGILILFYSLVGLKQLNKAQKNQPTFNQFQTDMATTYSTPSNSVSQSSTPILTTNNETIENWLGPITRVDKGAISYSIAAKEVDKQAENTLFFTSVRVIALMLAPPDAQNLQQGVFGSAASTLINYSADSAADKGQEFRLLHSKHWDKLVEPLLQQPLSSILQNHFNYAIPYSNIQLVKLENSLINPGFNFQLKDGSHLRYAVMRKDRMDEIKNYLQQKLRVE